jgi:hypothetical protein
VRRHLRLRIPVASLSFYCALVSHALYRNNTLKQLQDALDARPVVLIVEFVGGMKRLCHVVTRIDFLSWTFDRIVAKTKA